MKLFFSFQWSFVVNMDVSLDLRPKKKKLVLTMKFPSDFFLVLMKPCQLPQRECTMHKQETL